jgi:hypothetical protein
MQKKENNSVTEKLLGLDLFKTQVPQLSLNGYSNGVPSIPGLCASILVVAFTLIYSIF